MNRLLSFILAILFMASSCRKYEIVEQNAPHKPCILQFELPDSVGKWRIDTFPLPKNDRYNKDIFFVNENVGFLLKDYHTLFKTSDGGKTWAQINSFSNYESAEEVYFINENIGFVSVFGRPNARLLTTIDGGRTWENRIFPMNGTVQNIHFMDNTHGFALVTGFKTQNTLTTALFETKNQGRTWEEIPVSDSIASRGELQFLDDKKAFLIASKGNYKDYLLKSNDGGAEPQRRDAGRRRLRRRIVRKPSHTAQPQPRGRPVADSRQPFRP